jgi:diguanylate cyclase (GGDEF)-like protein
MDKKKKLLVITDDEEVRAWIGSFRLGHGKERPGRQRSRSIESFGDGSTPKALLVDASDFPSCVNKVLAMIGKDGPSYEAAGAKTKEETDRLNLLELELVKGLQHMIGETEEPVAILKHAFSLIKSYLDFDVFAALIPRRQEEEIYVYPNAPIRAELAEAIPGTLLKRMAKLSEETDTGLRVVMERNSLGPGPQIDDLRSVIIPLVSGVRTYGYAGIYRAEPFAYHEESVFKRFCAHVATALEKISLFEEIKALSTSDGLTNLHNHIFIVNRLDHEVQRSGRYGSPLSILMADVDDFKEVNDTHGHIAGDTVLADIADLLKAGVRSIDSVGRYGGEEFLVILPETDGPAAVLIADRLRQTVQDHPFMPDGKTVSVTLSGGVATYREGFTAKEFIAAADENLYRAKKEGKNKVYYDEL